MEGHRRPSIKQIPASQQTPSAARDALNLLALQLFNQMLLFYFSGLELRDDFLHSAS